MSVEHKDLPADRSHLATEQRHAASRALDTMSTRERIEVMVDDHRMVTAAVADAAAPLADFIDALASRYAKGGRLIYLGAGTSGRLGVLDASECPPTFQVEPERVVGVIAGGDRSLRRSSEAREDDPHGATEALVELDLNDRDTVLGIAAGGTTPYVLGALAIADARGTLTGLLTCVPLSPPPPGCRHLICLETGPEILTGSTRLKAGSATKLALNVITTSLFVELGKVYDNLMVDLRASNEKLRDRALRILCELCPELSRVEAAARLESAGGDLKTAVVMHRRGLDRAGADAHLARHHRDLRLALSD